MVRNVPSLFVRIALIGVAMAVPVAHGCSASPVPTISHPAGIRVDVAPPTAPETPSSPTNRYPLTFVADQARTFTIDVTVFDDAGNPATSFDGRTAWVRLTMSPGQIVSVVGPQGPNDPDVVGQNVHLTQGQIKGVKVSVIAAYGDTRIVAQDVGFVPAPPDTVSQCQDGIDNDNNGLADYPVDPGCFFLNDDTEGVGTNAYGVSSTIYYDFPRIHDVQGGTTPSKFNSKQVEILGDDTTPKRMVVTGITNSGMYVTDIDDFARGFNSIYVFNFSAPYGVRVCDKLARLAGNVSNFYGFTELGTPGWTDEPWISDEQSGPCPVPAFVTVTDTMALDTSQMQALSSGLMNVKSPVIGTHFGEAKPQNGVPSDGASNCDLNGDGIVGFNANKAGYNLDEANCNKACENDVDCSEWNNYLSRGTVKIKFGANNGLLFFDPGQIPAFDTTKVVGPNKIAEIRGEIRVFVGPTPPFTVQSRCGDDFIAVGQDPTTIKDVQHACVRPRVGADAEGSN